MTNHPGSLADTLMHEVSPAVFQGKQLDSSALLQMDRGFHGSLSSFIFVIHEHGLDEAPSKLSRKWLTAPRQNISMFFFKYINIYDDMI